MYKRTWSSTSCFENYRKVLFKSSDLMLLRCRMNEWWPKLNSVHTHVTVSPVVHTQLKLVQTTLWLRTQYQVLRLRTILPSSPQIRFILTIVSSLKSHAFMHTHEYFSHIAQCLICSQKLATGNTVDIFPPTRSALKEIVAKKYKRMIEKSPGRSTEGTSW